MTHCMLFITTAPSKQVWHSKLYLHENIHNKIRNDELKLCVSEYISVSCCRWWSRRKQGGFVME